MLRQLIPQFRALLEEPDQPVLRRLFPPAYSEAAYTEQQEEYRRLMQEDLVVRHREELDLLVSTADAARLSEEQLLAWTGALNSVRLVLGTFLDVQEGDEGGEPASRGGIDLPLAHLPAGRGHRSPRRWNVTRRPD